MKSRSEQEWNIFESRFKKYQDKKIILYGIGRGTASLIAGNTCFAFVGLMDRDEENIGKNMYGLPIVSLSDAEKIADMIVISAPETYWETIYKRIQKSKVPVYYRNGERAYISEKKVMTAQEIEKQLKSLSMDDITTRMIDNVCKELLNQNEDNLVINSLYSYGYCIWGPIVYTFCEWLYWKSREKNINQLVFLSRDGYLLQQDYDFFIERNNFPDVPESRYLLTSRRIAFVSAIETIEDFYEWAFFPFNGTFQEYMWNRFMLDVYEDENAKQIIQLPYDREKIEEWIKKYSLQIRNNIEGDKVRYTRYLENFGLQDNFALVDIGYSGNIQRKISNILHKELTGFYFVCDLSPENECLRGNALMPCFQKECDINARESAIYRRPQLLEAMFTAPYGMVMTLDEHLEKICSSPSKNQFFWKEHIEINKGIQSFIRDMGCINDVDKKVEERRIVSDQLFGILSDNLTLNDSIKKIFYWDDIIVQSRQNTIF